MYLVTADESIRDGYNIEIYLTVAKSEDEAIKNIKDQFKNKFENRFFDFKAVNISAPTVSSYKSPMILRLTNVEDNE